MEFTPPDGIRIPDGIEIGDTFESMTTYRLCKGDKIEAVAIEGTAIPSAKKSKDFVQSYQDAMKGETDESDN